MIRRQPLLSHICQNEESYAFVYLSCVQTQYVRENSSLQGKITTNFQVL